MISTQIKEGEHKRDWALWVLVGPDDNSVGVGLVCRQQLFHVSLKDGKGNHSAWLSWRKHEVSTLSICTRQQRLKRNLCDRLMDEALIPVHELTLEKVRARHRSVFMYKCGVCSLTQCERAPTCVYHRAQFCTFLDSLVSSQVR